VVTLRLANFIGPTVHTPLTDYFMLPVLPTVLGFDARLQFVHEDDGLEALRLATVGRATGVVNVAGDGVITLSQAARMAGRPTIGVPKRLTGLVGQVFRREELYSGPMVQDAPDIAFLPADMRRSAERSQSSLYDHHTFSTPPWDLRIVECPYPPEDLFPLPSPWAEDRLGASQVQRQPFGSSTFRYRRIHSAA